ncbi:MAG: hypothetical protein KDC18_19275 [Alphaproteobacteria bacterium]|nr:hypothetical protein [Alphaproteobacteria bacterium]
MDIERFSLLAAQRGLRIESADILSRLYAGYCSLQVLLARMPANPEPAIDPASVFLGDGGEVRR